MADFVLTVFGKSGENLMNEPFEARDEPEAKEIGAKRLKEEGFENHTSRVTSSTGKLVLFHR